MRDGYRLGICEILAGSRICDSRRLQSIEWRARDGRFVAEVPELEHLFRVRARDDDEPVVRDEHADPALCALLVHEIEELAFRDRIRREVETIGKIEMLGLVLADSRDEERRSAELPSERPDV